jgi:hypothetical protein
MKILDIPQSGKRGLNVSQAGANGQMSRALAIPANPRSPAQMSVRRILTGIAAKWRTLTEEQRLAWIAAGKEVKSTSRLGQSGPLNGFQLFAKINCALAEFGQEQVEAPPVRPLFPELVPQNLVIANAAGVITLKLTCPTDPGEFTIIRASKPLSQGRSKCSDVRVLGLCPVPAQGAADITALYEARYGLPRVGDKVYVQINQLVDGWESLPMTFSAIVPVAGA